MVVPLVAGDLFKVFTLSKLNSLSLKQFLEIAELKTF